MSRGSQRPAGTPGWRASGPRTQLALHMSIGRQGHAYVHRAKWPAGGRGKGRDEEHEEGGGRGRSEEPLEGGRRGRGEEAGEGGGGGLGKEGWCGGHCHTLQGETSRHVACSSACTTFLHHDTKSSENVLRVLSGESMAARLTSRWRDCSPGSLPLYPPRPRPRPCGLNIYVTVYQHRELQEES